MATTTQWNLNDLIPCKTAQKKDSYLCPYCHDRQQNTPLSPDGKNKDKTLFACKTRDGCGKRIRVVGVDEATLVLPLFYGDPTQSEVEDLTRTEPDPWADDDVPMASVPVEPPPSPSPFDGDEWLPVSVVRDGFGFKNNKSCNSTITKKGSKFYNDHKLMFQTEAWVKGRASDDKLYHIDCVKAWSEYIGKPFGSPKSKAIVSPNAIPTDADFDSIREPDGTWSARKLAVLMDYDSTGNSWNYFRNAIEKARMIIRNNGLLEQNHIYDDINMILPVGKNAKRTDCKDFKLSEYACYAVALECDSSKQAVAAAKNRFIIAYKAMKEMSHPEAIDPMVRAATDGQIQQLHLGMADLKHEIADVKQCVGRVAFISERSSYAGDRRQCLERYCARLRLDKFDSLCDIPFWCSDNSSEVVKALPNFQDKLPKAKGAYVIMAYVVRKVHGITFPQAPLCLYVGITEDSFKDRLTKKHDCIDLFEILGDECKQVVNLCETESIHYEIFFYPLSEKTGLKLIETKLTAIFEPVWLSEPNGMSFKEYMASMTNDLLPITKVMADTYVSAA